MSRQRTRKTTTGTYIENEGGHFESQKKLKRTANNTGSFSAIRIETEITDSFATRDWAKITFQRTFLDDIEKLSQNAPPGDSPIKKPGVYSVFIAALQFHASNTKTIQYGVYLVSQKASISASVHGRFQISTLQVSLHSKSERFKANSQSSLPRCVLRPRQSDQSAFGQFFANGVREKHGSDNTERQPNLTNQPRPLTNDCQCVLQYVTVFHKQGEQRSVRELRQVLLDNRCLLENGLLY